MLKNFKKTKKKNKDSCLQSELNSFTCTHFHVCTFAQPKLYGYAGVGRGVERWGHKKNVDNRSGLKVVKSMILICKCQKTKCPWPC